MIFEGCSNFRTRIILSLLSGKPVKIRNIRSQDNEPGLKEFEVNFLRLVDKITNGTSLEVNETGTDLYFQPGLLIGGSISHECCKLRGIGYYLELIFMVTPYCKKGIHITLKGVTNNEKDPSVDAFKTCALPILQRILLLATDVTMDIKKRGMEPDGGGEIYFSCEPVKYTKPIQLTEFGKIKKIRGTFFSLRVSPTIANRMVEKAKANMLKFIPDVYFTVDHPKGKLCGNSPGFGANIVSLTTNGIVLNADSVSLPFSGKRTTAEEIAENVSSAMLEEIWRGGCVDSSFQSLILLYMALRQKDVSHVVLGPLSPYTIQFLRHLKIFFGITFKLEPYNNINEDEDLRQGYNSRILVTGVGIGYNKLI
ncbi:RNA 3'-terminal phosphate cyclase-like protein [Daktulosphaira vitifoliae]|uniref:RNA 3'-terminal phosphate cyclase-like protein n=1 Tax=Daktulosphaira vitifoliae TaxID=58002 RepID=UPI0021AA9DCE|nr:RNA 3'-terminal phosphate cyclase-like protein [Daktulosphaira vitifoliae]